MTQGIRHGKTGLTGVFLLLVFLATQARAGQVLHAGIDSQTLGRPWPYTVYLPDGYGDSGLEYPVLYLLHGNGGDEKSWLALDIVATADALITAGDIPPVVIVMPEANTTWYVDRKEAMESAVVEELLPAIANRYRVLNDRANRLVGGYSMGGYGAMRLAMKYPYLFGAAALLSPAIYNPLPPMDSSSRRVGVFGGEAFDPDDWESLNYPALWDAFVASGIAVPLYINSGDDDDFFIEAEATRFYSRLRAQGLPAELRIVDGCHCGEVPASTVGDAMRYILGHGAAPR